MDLRERPEQSSQRHPWELARLAFFSGVLADTGMLARPLRVLDVGAGDAWFARHLAERCHKGTRITCWDVEYDPHSADSLGLNSGDAIELRVDRPEGRFDLVLLLDVLEHTDDDLAFLTTTVARNLAAGGTVLVSVPAWPALMSSHDIRLHHRRRYTPARLHRLLDDAGLERVRGGGLFHSLLMPRALSVAREKLKSSAPGVEEPELSWDSGPLATRLVRTALAVDNWVSRAASRARLELPGLSSWALCRGSPSSSPVTTNTSD